ncbi:MAG TPA: four helix bundle protein [Candidatus Paceibacterota bacterium]
MENARGQIKTFTDLDAWKIGHEIVLETYKVTKTFPKDELFALTSQMRRCVVSITSNIAEGFSRQSYKEKLQFYSISQGSVTELQNQVLIARDIGYLDNEIHDKLANKLVTLQKILNGLIKKTRSFSQS